MAGKDARGIPLATAAPVFPYRSRALPLETTSNLVLCFGIGLLIGVLTIRTEYVGAPRDLFSRVAPVDFLCLTLLAFLFFVHSMKAPLVRSMVYAGAIVFSLVPGLLFSDGERFYVWVSAAALLMAFGYYLIGLNIGGSPPLMRALLSGLCFGVMMQTVVVAHDTVFSHSQWFPDPMEGRVRGTFKTNGQLGAYSFCAAGLLLTFGTTQGSTFFRRTCCVLGLASSSFVFMASRRMGMLCVALWGALFTFTAMRHWRRRSYQAFVTTFVAALVGVIVMWPQIEDTFVGQRFMSAVNGMGKDDGFIQNQFKAVFDQTGRWFPFGMGVGAGSEVNPYVRQEIHNGVLAIMVELGVAGVLSFLAMVLFPIFKGDWGRRSESHGWLRMLIFTFLIMSLLFMFHNTLARDRVFLLFLGIATSVVIQESKTEEPSVYFPAVGNP